MVTATRTPHPAAPDNPERPFPKLKPLPDVSQDWQAYKACGIDTADLFFNPMGERDARKNRRNAAAKRICRTCPVQAHCLRTALANREPFGVWGGLTTPERETILAARDAHDTDDAAGQAA